VLDVSDTPCIMGLYIAHGNARCLKAKDHVKYINNEGSDACGLCMES